MNSTRQTDEIKKFLKKARWNNPIAISCTCLKAYRIPEGFHPVCRFDCVENLRHVLNQLNREVMGRKRKMQVVPVLEVNLDGRFHFHILMDVPVGRDPADIAKKFMARWRASRCGHEQLDIVQAHDPAGWIDYMLKRRGKQTSIGDAVVWENVHCSSA